MTLSGIPFFFINSFRLASLLVLLVGLNLSHLIGALAWFIKITRVASFESVEVFGKNLFLALYFTLSSSMIFWLLCLLPSAALFTLTIWPFGPSTPRSLLRWRPHKELCFDWIAGLSTSVFFSIQANVRSLSSQWIPTKPTSSPTSFYSPPFQSNFNFSWGSPSTALFPFLNGYLRRRPNSSHVSRPYAVSLLPQKVALRSPFLFCIKLFFGPFSHMLGLDGFLA